MARGTEIQVVDVRGNVATVFRLPAEEARQGLWCHEPRLLLARPRERIIPSRVDPSKTTGTLVLGSVHKGRNMTGVEPGEIRELLVLESLPKPINYTGGMDPLSWGGTFTLERVVGTVPVEEDDTADTLADRILVEEHQAYPEALSLLLTRRWTVDGRRVVLR